MASGWRARLPSIGFQRCFALARSHEFNSLRVSGTVTRTAQLKSRSASYLADMEPRSQLLPSVDQGLTRFDRARRFRTGIAAARAHEANASVSQTLSGK